MSVKHLPIAVRAFTVRNEDRNRSGSGSQDDPPGCPRYVLLFDTETTTDTTQRLTFGSYRLCERLKNRGVLVCKEEGLFYADDLAETNPEGLACLQEYVKTQKANVDRGFPRRLKLLSRTGFVDRVFWRYAYMAKALVVGFNLPFDLSRLALDCGKAQRGYRGGFSFIFWGRREGRQVRWRAHPNRPRVNVKHLDSKKSFTGFGRPKKDDSEDQGPAAGGPPKRRRPFRGRLLDLKTFAFALTDRAHTLRSACEDFGVAHPKTEAEQHGVITPEYIDYNRRDVLASQELLEKLREEFDLHQLELDPCQAFSPASIAKEYLRKMGLRPPAEQFGNIPPELMGYAMSSFYGGRAECRIRKTPVPVLHTDFTSMYPTVQSLMGLWDALSAKEIEVEEATEEVQQLLARISVDECFRQETWPELVGLAQVIPQGDVLPNRAKYRHDEWTVGVNHLTGEDPLWFALPDLAASALLTGRPPKILRAIRIRPKGRQRLNPVQMRGEVPIDPRKENPFPAVIEERQRVKRHDERTQRFLKVFANSGSYGIFAQMDRKETPKKKPATVTVYGCEGSFSCSTTTPEDPGDFCFPPIGAVITAAARLMLALLECCVTDAGGSYAFADTDSMAIVSSKEGGFIACEGGEYPLSNGGSAVRALSWAEADAIVARFEALNPYDRSAVPGSILKIEDVNYERPGGPRRQLFAYVISAKRYALFTIGADGHPVVPRTKDAYSEHGLGQLLNPTDPESEDREWIRQVWGGLVWEALGGPPFRPPWGDRPAMMKSAVTTPVLLKRFGGLNRRKDYADRVKPFNFLLSALVNPLDRPPSVKPSEGFQLIAPYSRNPSEWLRLSWIDTHSGQKYRVKTQGHSDPLAIRIQTFDDVLDRFRNHPEAKSADSNGNPSNQRTVGLLGRVHVHAISITHIGKETNLLEQQQEGVSIADPQAVYSGEADWEKIRSQLDQVSISELSHRSGVSARRLREYRQGIRRPSANTRKAITAALGPMLDEEEAEASG